MLERLRAAIFENALEMDASLGRRFKKDGRGLFFRQFERLQLSLVRRAASYERDPAIRMKIDKEGFDLGPVYDTDTIDSIRSKIEPHFEDAENPSGTADHEEDAPLLQPRIDIEEADDELMGLLKHPDIIRTARAYFGTDFRPAEITAVRNRPFPNGKSDWYARTGIRFTRWWHLDGIKNTLLNQIRFIILLSDQNEQTSTQLVSAPQTRNLLDEFTYEELRREEHDIAKKADVKEFSGRRGSALMFNGRTQLHRGVSPRPGGTREILIFTLVPTLSR